MQVNFRVDDSVAGFLELLSKQERKSKTTISKEIFMSGIKKILYPYLSKLYKTGQISIKQISELTGDNFLYVMDRVAENINDIDVDDDIMEYSEIIASKMSELL